MPGAPGQGKAVLDSLLLEGGNALIDVDYELELVEGDPAEALASSAREHDAGEIAIGSRGFGKLRAALGSVSHDVLHEADRRCWSSPTTPCASTRERAA